MKKCPYCDFRFPDDKKNCPKCGSPYWKPGEDKEFNDIPKDDSEDEKNGCLSLVFMPVSIALLIAGILVSAGFLLNLLIHIENNPVKVIWVLLSVAAGLFAYRFFNKKQK
jgi:uncharacterized membrane protein YvbJ